MSSSRKRQDDGECTRFLLLAEREGLSAGICLKSDRDSVPLSICTYIKIQCIHDQVT